ncbi:DegV family protein [Arabiibacter massiliensis]|uniref:DegV family protein n=1 Tax=Arabiibacter massiliensis TaxID=1870985 RepID=UPI0009BC1DEE|nr:DegV family protein [Arabiibacter massiliensis]
MSERIAIATDTNSGIMADEAARLGVHVVPMPFVVDGEECFEGVSLDAARFYELQEAGANIVTSQPSIVDLGVRWRDLLETHDAVVYIPMSSGLSGSCETARGLAEHFEGRVQVADNQRISVTQREAALDALRWAREGRSAEEIRARLEETRLDASIYLMVDTMDHLRKSGRITPAAAAVGSVLKIKPVLQIQGEKLDAFSVAKSVKAAKRTMIKALARDVDERFGGVENVHLYVAHTNREADALALADEMREAFGTDDVYVDRLPLSIACHVGPGALGIGCAKRQG